MTDLYAAAVDAADVEPDLEATTDTYAHFTDAPLPLVEVVNEDGERKLRLVPETADVIASIDAELCVVAMCGPHRSGKSSLLNWLRDPAGQGGDAGCISEDNPPTPIRAPHEAAYPQTETCQSSWTGSLPELPRCVARLSSCDVIHRRHSDVCDVLKGCSDATTSCITLHKQANTPAAFAKMRGGVFSKP